MGRSRMFLDPWCIVPKREIGRLLAFSCSADHNESSKWKWSENGWVPHFQVPVSLEPHTGAIQNPGSFRWLLYTWMAMWTRNEPKLKDCEYDTVRSSVHRLKFSLCLWSCTRYKPAVCVWFLLLLLLSEALLLEQIFSADFCKHLVFQLQLSPGPHVSGTQISFSAGPSLPFVLGRQGITEFVGN